MQVVVYSGHKMVLLVVVVGIAAGGGAGVVY